MNYFLATALLLIIATSPLISQEGTKIDLNNVNVGTQRLPTIFLFGEEFTARERNELLRGLLKSQFYRQDLKITINLQEFISKRAFSFRHIGPVEISVDGRKLKNRNSYNTVIGYQHQPKDSELNRLLIKVKDVRIDSSLNGMLKRRSLAKEIKSTDEKIKILLEEIEAEIEGDTIIVSNKKKEKELNKIYRIKNRQEKEFNESSLIEIKIITN